LRKVSILLMVILFMNIFAYSRTDRNFDKMVSYYILKDIKMAKVESKTYFEKYSDAQLSKSYSLLFNNNIEDANEAFFNYLQMKPRSVEGLIGFALSDTGKVKSTILNLQKAVRLDENSTIALLCIANEYLKELNYPKSEHYFKLATKTHSPIEYKIIWSFLFLKQKKPDKIIELLKNEFIDNQTNFYLNYLLASAYYLNNNFELMEKHIDLLNGVGENKKIGDLLIAKYYIKKRDFKMAKSILFNIEHKEGNEDYSTALAITMMNLNNSKSLHYLYKAFKINMWNKEINKQLGIYFYKREKNEMVQNFIYRTLLSGISAEKLKKYFSGINFDIPEYKTKLFFQLYDMKWMDNNTIAVFAKKNSGDKTTVYIIDTDKNDIIRSLNLPKSEKGVFNKAFVSKTGNIVFALFSSSDDIMSIYSLRKFRNRYEIGKIVSIKSYMHEYLKEPSIIVGFDNSGTIAYITDGGINTVAFKSPFLVKWSLTNTKPAYPKYPFDIIKYNFNSKEAFKILNPNQIKLLPLKPIKKYFLINQAYIGSSKVKDFIIKGQEMDLISPKKVYTFFEDNLKSFLIYIKGSENSFNAILYKDDNSSVKLSETMFVGEKILNETIDIKLFKLNSIKNNIILMRKDTNQLIDFNYKTFLYSYLNKNVKQLYYSPYEDVYYSIILKGDVSGMLNTSSEMFSINPYRVITKYERNDITKIIECDRMGDISFYTRNEEKLKINSSNKFEYIGPAFNGVIHSITKNKYKEAVYINGKLIIINKKKKRIIKTD